jgi:hypothetical protein
LGDYAKETPGWLLISPDGAYGQLTYHILASAANSTIAGLEQWIALLVAHGPLHQAR